MLEFSSPRSGELVVAMNSFALLADDVEDVDDLAPPTPVEEPVVKSTPAAAKQTSANSTTKKEQRRDGQRNNNARNGHSRGSFRGDRRRERRDGQDANGSGEADKPLAENAEDGNTGDGEEPTTEPVDEGPADMTLDEYLAQKKADARVELRKSGINRKANEVGGKMAVLKKGNEDDLQETSIMSAVTLKEKANERAVKDSTHTAVAHKAKNQEFFKNVPGFNNHGRSYRGRGRGRGRGGYGRGRDYRGRYEGRHMNNVNVQSPNVDDPTAFPTLGA